MKATIQPPPGPQIRLIPAPTEPEPSPAALCLTTARHEIVIEPWPPRAWRRSHRSPGEGGAWHEYTPHIDLDWMIRYSRSFDDAPRQLLLPFGQPRDNLAPAARAASYDRFRQAIPQWALKLALGIRARQFDLLRFLAFGQAARELAEANLALAFLVSATIEHSMWPEVIELKQRDLVDLLGFPPTERSVRILRKLTPASITMPRLRRVRDALWDPVTAKLLAHCRRVPPSILLGVTYPHTRAIASPPLLRDVVSNEGLDDARFARNLEHVLSIADEWGVSRRIGRPRSLKQLMNNVGSLRLLQDLSHLGSPRRMVFPPPPVPGIEGLIEPITSPFELAMEAGAQHNCVVNMADDVVRRQRYFYRLLRPERATICIEAGAQGWELSDAKTVNNGEPEPKTHLVVWSWLLAYHTQSVDELLDPDEVVGCLHHASPIVRAAALKALKEGKLVNAATIGRVVELTDDSTRAVREAAIEAFDGVEVAVVKTVVDDVARMARNLGSADEAQGLLTILGGMAHESEAAMEVIRWASEHPNYEMRYAAIAGLDCTVCDPSLVPLLLGALTDPDENVRRTAGGVLEAFSREGAEEGMPEGMERLGLPHRRRRRRW